MTDQEGDRPAGGVSGRRLGGFRQLRHQGEPRSIGHRVKVTEDQERRLQLMAAARRVTVARLMVESTLAGGAEQAETLVDAQGELYRFARVLGKIGVNVNQIARATNATGQTHPETAAAMESLTRVCGRLDGLLDELGAPR